MVANGDVLSALGPQLELLLPHLDEKGRRLTLGAAALAAGEGGATAVARLTGASWQTVSDGAAELASGDTAPPGRVRRPGGGRKKLADTDPGLVPDLLDLVGDSTRGDPESPLQWTTKSLRHLADALRERGHRCSPQTVRLELMSQGYSLQAPAKVLEGTRHPDRDAQFRYITERVKEHLAAGQPVLSLDAKKKEEVGDYAPPGREWHPKGTPPQVQDHSFFPGRGGPGHAVPYGIYDQAANSGFVNVGTGASTGEFAAASLRRWHGLVGKDAYPGAARLLITCDSGSSNGIRNRAWKKELARFAEDTGLEITVCHFPPGTSKWNAIEHRLFSQISLAWRGRPLTSYEVIVSTIGAVTTSTGLTASAVLGTRPCETGKKISDAEIRDIEERYLDRHAFHGDWNYTVLPQPRPARPEPEPDLPPRVPLASLNQPALTGLDPADLLALAGRLEAAAEASREHYRRVRCPGPGPKGGRHGRKPRLATADLVAAACIRDYLGLPRITLAPFFGLSTTSFREALRHVLLALDVVGGIPPPAQPPPAAPPRTAGELTAYAAARGIDLTLRPPGKPQTAPETTLATADTPQTHLILERLRGVCAAVVAVTGRPRRHGVTPA